MPTIDDCDLYTPPVIPELGSVAISPVMESSGRGSIAFPIGGPGGAGSAGPPGPPGPPGEDGQDGEPQNLSCLPSSELEEGEANSLEIETLYANLIKPSSCCANSCHAGGGNYIDVCDSDMQFMDTLCERDNHFEGHRAWGSSGPQGGAVHAGYEIQAAETGVVGVFREGNPAASLDNNTTARGCFKINGTGDSVRMEVANDSSKLKIEANLETLGLKVTELRESCTIPTGTQIDMKANQAYYVVINGQLCKTIFLATQPFPVTS